MKIYIIAAEKSGDQHAGALLKQLRLLSPSLEVRAVGGEDLQEAGADLFLHYQAINFMGVWEVLKNLGTINRKIAAIKADVAAFRPDAIIHVDASSLNMRIAAYAQTLGIQTLYYIAPKIWAWNTGRVHKIQKLFSKIFVIFPFEKKFYAQHNVPASYAGNPTLEAVHHYLQAHPAERQSYIALLPGSRVQEIRKSLDVYLAVAKRMPERQFRIAALSLLPGELYAEANACPNVELVFDDTYALLASAEAACVVSGTATLETALFGVPQVVCYRTSPLTALVGRMVIKVPFISLVNLVAEKEAVVELIQDDFNPARLQKELEAVLPGGSRREQVLADYSLLRNELGQPIASATAAREIAEYLGLG